MSVLDLSNHDESTFNAECLAEAGVTRVIMGCQFSGFPARRMIPKLREAGIEVRDVYTFLGFRNWWREPTQHAIDVAREFDIPMVWLDAEADSASDGSSGDDVTPITRLFRLNESINMVETAGLKVGIYTARWWWVPRMPASADFSDLPLWLGGPYQAAPIRTVDFGGWTDVAIHQYTSSLFVCGRGRDANYVFEEDTVTREEYEDLLLAVFAGGEQRDVNNKVSPRDERVAIAKSRMALRAAGVNEVGTIMGSVRDQAESAGINAKLARDKIDEHSRDHAAGVHQGGGTFVVKGSISLTTAGVGE